MGRDVDDPVVTGKIGESDTSTAARMRRYRARHRERVRVADRKRDRSGRYEANTRQKYAWNLTAAAIRRGRLVKQPCEVCGAASVQAHHDDYSNPLDVRWLCRAHHEETHQLMRPAFSLGNERSPLYGASSGEPVRPDPLLLSEDELTEIRLRDIAFGDAEELGWS